MTFAVLRAGGSAIVLDLLGPRTPRVLHWGADIGVLDERDVDALRLAVAQGQGHSAFDQPLTPTITYDVADGYYGYPMLSGHRAGTAFSPKFAFEDAVVDPAAVRVTARDDAAQLRLETTFEMSSAGILTVRHTLHNNGNDVYTLDDLNVALPVPAHAVELMDFTGNWSREFHPQNKRFDRGLHVREIREGRTGHDNTLLLIARSEGSSFSGGEHWAVSLAWSGNSRYFAEQLYDGSRRIGAGELLLPGEVLLEPAASYVMPDVVLAYSNAGLDGLAAIFHSHLRSRPHHPRRPRPLTINVWEAVYMDHRLDKLIELADVAKDIGLERFVLDDGWFGARRNDLAGLGDWVVSPDAWPQGLHPLARALEERGLEFGLWFEPEMVNADSDLFRAHPEWILHVGDRTPPTWRYQQVLDLSHAGAFEHVLSQIDNVLTEYPTIRYLKWDHNRPLTDPGHLGHAGVRSQTLALYRLLDTLKNRHPGLEIESCASGGGRVDLGILEYTDRVWASDCNDALERQRIQRWTAQVLPPELIGSHIGPTHSHTTGRTHSLGFRAVTALFGHAGIEWDITETTDAEREQLRSWAAYYKANRALLHSGRMVRADYPSTSSSLHGVVAADQSRAIFAFVQESVTAESRPAALRFPGLSPERRYRVQVVTDVGVPDLWQITSTPWTESRVELTGRSLADVGVTAPILRSEQALLVEITAI